MICVQFEIVCTLQIDFFLFCPQGKKRNIQAQIIKNDIRDYWEYFHAGISVELPDVYYTRIGYCSTTSCRKIYVKDLHWRQETLFAEDCIWNPPTPSIFFTQWRLLKFIVVFFIPFSMSKKVGSMCGVVCIRKRSLFAYILPISSLHDSNKI